MRKGSVCFGLGLRSWSGRGQLTTGACCWNPHLGIYLHTTRYQLVPGALIARLWFNSIFPPPLHESKLGNQTVYTSNPAEDNVFSSLLVISTSLAVGLILGFALVRLPTMIKVCWEDRDAKKRQAASGTVQLTPDEYQEQEQKQDRQRATRDRFAGMFTSPDDDPSDMITDTDAAAAAAQQDTERASATNAGLRNRFVVSEISSAAVSDGQADKTKPGSSGSVSIV